MAESAVARTDATDEVEPDEALGDVQPAAVQPVPLSEALADAGVFDRQAADDDEEPDAAPRGDDEEPARSQDGSGASGRRRARRDRTAARSAARAAKRDRIVEAPRAPKKSLGERLRSVAGGTDATGEESAAPRDRRKRLVSLLAVLIGAAGLVCSILLATGALLVALDATGGSVYEWVSGICDALVGPLRDAFSFSGTNAATKESLAAWGAGAIVYLVVGTAAQSLLRSIIDD
ncbi:MAG: hypothetical protein ABWY58_13130 [Aeromicrobium sp.]